MTPDNAKQDLSFHSPGFRGEVDKLDKNKTYVVYCRSVARSAAARDVMEELGFKNVINVAGGITDWIAEGLPVVKYYYSYKLTWYSSGVIILPEMNRDVGTD